MNFRPLPPTFARKDTIEVALALIGKLLILQAQDFSVRVSRIVETEAYLGEEDPACHTFGGRKTPRTQAMYGTPGTAYVYFIYGMYYCLNVVTGKGESVLIRALEPLEGFTEEQRRNKVLSGPGKLCRELGITKELNQKNLFDPGAAVFIAAERDGLEEHSHDVIHGERVGISSAGDAAHWPLRFGLKDSAFLSSPRF